jgi:hypothetical protein
VQLAQRTAVYGGVMAARIEALRDGQSAEPAARPAAQQDQQHMELAAVRVAFPGLISVTRVSPQEEVE